MALATAGLIVCGPMLRRVDREGFTVFLALRGARDVQLVLHDGTAAASPVLDSSPSTSARKIGANLYALALQCETPLESGRVYGYDIKLRDPATGRTDNLASLGLLGGATPLGYEPAETPGFVLPSHDLDEVRLLHASCRLPSAEGPDVLQVLDAIISESRSSPSLRPQQLFLTGDQIYADDVEPSLCFFAQFVGGQLLGWPGPEMIPGWDPAAFSPPGPTERAITDFQLWPGRRLPVLETMAGVTSTHAASHLLAFAEFVAIYCLVWSPELWNWSGGSIGSGNVVLPGPSEIWPGSQWLSRENENLRRAAIEELKTKQWRVIALGRGTPQVRRALANIATFMMFDDHEVTDDWNLHRHWCETVYASDMGRRLVQNGLSAFAIFQAWGNEPKRFAAGTPGDTLLGRIGNWAGDKLGGEEIQAALGLPNKGEATAPGTIRWDYEVNCGAYDVIVLDTRTHRGFAPPAEDRRGRLAPALLGAGEVQRQLLDRLAKRQRANRVVEATIVIAPPPVIGHPLIEAFLQRVGGWFWNVHVPVVLDEHREGAAEFDQEAWSFHPLIFEELLDALSRFGRVVVLSGDVHYGFSARVEYWNQRAGALPRSTIIQLTASGLRNEGDKNRDLGSRLAPRPWGRSSVGWTTDEPHIRVALLFSHTLPQPAVIDVPFSTNMAFAREPDWRYRIRFAVDERPGDQRMQFPMGWPSVPTSPLSDQTKELLELGEEQRRRMKFKQMRAVVGHNNFGDVRFAGVAGFRMVRHALWYRPNPHDVQVSEFPIWPATVHHLLLEPPADSAPMPNELIP